MVPSGRGARGGRGVPLRGGRVRCDENDVRANGVNDVPNLCDHV